MTVVLLQHQKPIAAFETESRRALRASDDARAQAIARQTAALETGYYDVLLIPGRLSAAAYSAACVEPARVTRWYADARDQFIGVK